MRGAGYLISIGSVLLLALVAWPGPAEPAWHLPVLLAGVLLSILGMSLRWLASHKDVSEIHQLERATNLHQPAE